jgi:voltage-gated potassium channel Kch
MEIKLNIKTAILVIGIILFVLGLRIIVVDFIHFKVVFQNDFIRFSIVFLGSLLIILSLISFTQTVFHNKKAEGSVTVSLPTIELSIRPKTHKQYSNAFESGTTVTILSIMSQHTVKAIEHLLEKAKTTTTEIRANWMTEKIF